VLFLNFFSSIFFRSLFSLQKKKDRGEEDFLSSAIVIGLSASLFVIGLSWKVLCLLILMKILYQKRYQKRKRKKGKEKSSSQRLAQNIFSPPP